MDLWTIIQERFVILSIFTVTAFVCVALLFAVWKNRVYLSKSLSVVAMGLSAVILMSVIAAMIFIISFGYNA